MHRTECPLRGTAAIGFAIVALASGCGEPGGVPAADRSYADFCPRVTSRMEAFLDSVASALPVPDDPRYGGSAVVGGAGELADGLNAFVTGEYASVQHQQFVGMMTLITYDSLFRPAPYLARSWEVGDDGRTITFHLRTDVYWHDGEKTDADDVAFTYRTVTDPDTGYPNGSYWDRYVRGPEGIEVLDSATVRVHLEPHADYMDPWRVVAIMPEHLLADVPPEDFRSHPFGTRCPVGNGPFAVREHRPGDRWIFRANAAFPAELGGRPYLDELVYRVVPEPATLLVETLTGGVDVFIGVPVALASDIRSDAGVALVHFPSRIYGFVAWNSRRPQVADARVRRALTMAVDRSELVQGLMGEYGRVANSGVPPFHWAYDPEVAATPYDPARARALLEEAGWVDRDGDGVRESAEGVPLSISLKYNTGNSSRREIAVILQDRLARVGVSVEPLEVEWATLLGQIFEPGVRDFDGVVLAWASDFKLDETDLFHSKAADGPTGLAGIRSDVIDRYLDSLQVVTDRETGRALWVRYQEALERVHPYTYLYFSEGLAGVRGDLRGVRMDARGEWLSVRDWWRAAPAPGS